MKNNKNNLYKLYSSLMLGLTLIPTYVKADVSTESIYTFLRNNKEYIQFFDIMPYIGHTIGWFFVKFLYSCSAGLEKFIDLMFDLFGIGTSGLATSMDKLFGIHNLDKAYNYIKIAGFTILGICLLVFAIKYMASDKLDLKDTTIRILLAVTLIASCNIFISYSMTGGRMFFDGSKQMFNTATKDQSYALNIINNNTLDLYKLAQQNDNLISLGHGKEYIKPNLKDVVTFKDKEEFVNANLTDVLKENNEHLWDNISDNNKKILSKQLSNNNTNDKEKEVIDIKSHWIMKSFDKGYFRYGVHFFDTIVQLLIFIVATILTIFVLARHIFNMIVLYIITPLVVSSDISTGTKMKRIALDILKGGGAIACTGLSYSIFLAIFDKIMANDMNILLQLMLMLASAVALFDGAHAFNKYFDYDTGFKDGYKTLRGGQETIKTTTSLAKGVGSVAKGGVGVVKTGSDWINDKFGFGSDSSTTSDGKANSKFDEMDLENPFDTQNNMSNKNNNNENNANSSINEDQSNTDNNSEKDSNMINNESNNESNNQNENDDLINSTDLNDDSNYPIDDDNFDNYDSLTNDNVDDININDSINEDELIKNDDINDSNFDNNETYSSNQNENIDVEESNSIEEKTDEFITENPTDNPIESDSFDNNDLNNSDIQSVQTENNGHDIESLDGDNGYNYENYEPQINTSSDLNNDKLDQFKVQNESVNSSSSSQNESLNTSLSEVNDNDLEVKPKINKPQSYQIGSQKIDNTISNYSSNESKYTQPNLKTDNNEW